MSDYSFEAWCDTVQRLLAARGYSSASDHVLASQYGCGRSASEAAEVIIARREMYGR